MRATSNLFSTVDAYDIVIIGSGPGALATLSAIQEDYSLDMLSSDQINRASKWIRRNNSSRSKRRVCVIDPNPTWLHQWERNFDVLDISFLRSPAIAHCSYFDRNALLAFAISEGREDELFDTGCSDIKSLKGTILPQVGLWKLPSTKLFLDFSRAMAKSLPHDYMQDFVADIQKIEMKDGGSVVFKIQLKSDAAKSVTGKSVILSTGTIGKPIVPIALQNINSPRIFPWQNIDGALALLNKLEPKKRTIAVIGGGLTAVQAAHKIVQSTKANGQNTHVVLCSRRGLVERHFDIPVKWFDDREARIHQSQFYHESETERLQALRSTRGGGTVPPYYMRITRNMTKRGELSMIAANVSSVDENSDGTLLMKIENFGGSGCIKSEEIIVDVVVIACGIQADYSANPLVKNIQKKWPTRIVGGYPVVTEELMWTENLYVVGGLSSLSVGPDASNLMGLSRAAETVANALDSKLWLREESNVLRNPFEAFLDDNSSDDEDY